MGEKLVVVLAGAVLGAVLKTLGDWLWWRLTHPEVRLGFNVNEPGCKLSTLEQRENPVEPAKPLLNNAYYFNVAVRNTRTRTAKNVRGFLVSIEAQESGRWIMTDFCDNIPLAWSYREDDDARKGIDIPKDVPQFLNVLSIRDPAVGSGFVPATVPQTLKRASQLRFEDPGVFRFTIMVAGDDAPMKWIGLRVKWDGEWSEVWAGDCAGFSVVQDTTIRVGTGAGLLK